MLGLVQDPGLLEEIYTDMELPAAELEALRGNLRPLYRRIMAHMLSDEFEALQDNGLAYLMAARDKLRIALGIAAGDPTGAEGGPKPEPEDSDDEGANEFKDALETLEVNAVGAAGVALGKLRELKLSGTIGKPGQKGKLTYSSLLSQIKNAIKRGFDDGEICAAVVRCIDPNSALRNYLEEIDDLTVKKLIPTLQSHFQEKNATSLYNQMNNAVMSGEDTELSFCMELMALRDKIFKISTAQGGEYTKSLLQSQFQKALYTGIKNERVRQELKPLLSSKRKKPPSDKTIMTEITEICMLDLEHQLKVEPKSTARRASASVTSAETDQTDKGKKTQVGKITTPKTESRPTENLQISQEFAQMKSILAPLTTQVCELYGAVEKLNQDAYGQAYQPQQQVPQLPPAQQPQPQPQQPQLDPTAQAFAAYHDGFGNGQNVVDGQVASGRGAHTGRGAYWGSRGGRAMHWPAWFQDGFMGPGYSRGWAEYPGGYDQQNYQPPHQQQYQPPPPQSPQQPQQQQQSGGRGGSDGSRGGRGGRGSSRGGRGGHNNHGNGSQNTPFLCPSCQKAKAVYCNHCRVCYAIDHRTNTCPHKDDPNFVPTVKN